MNYNETLEYIHSLGMFSHPAGLNRITELLNRLDNPQNKFPAIHIAGTNGKGSVSVMIASVLKKAGYKVGLFTSPYIVDFAERITVNGEFISKDALCRLSEKVKNIGVAVTEFEFITAVGFLYFAEENCDVVVAETGLGGRLDATNTLNNVSVSVITKIGLDHGAILGNTVEKIAEEKCGIIKNNKTVTVSGQVPEALKVIKAHAPNTVIPEKPMLITSDISGNTFLYKGEEYKTSLAGEFQVENALAAIEAIGISGFNVPISSVKEGLVDAFIPARMEILSKEPLIVLDGAHNPDGASVLASFMEQYSGKITAIVGVMQDKDYGKVLETALKHCRTTVCVTPTKMPRALSGAELEREAKKYCADTVIAKDLRDALLLAKEKAQGSPIFIFGSLYLASNIRKLIK
ncbi:MAG: bifunctional folylpolyglutamate synthase/dihydrofolate synthase [Clostridia bacterium]|nr:bifunctional folylpolyglutamate synthase/dihydrofolate synthase [Clostridia bacterium]